MASTKRLPQPLLSNYDWQVDGACRNSEPNEFFAGDAERGNRRLSRDERAKAMCRQCPVLQRCFDHAMEVREPYGVWGATTPEERELIRTGRGSRVVGEAV